jgi:putative nucleotidyltransferase with HDIG domain
MNRQLATQIYIGALIVAGIVCLLSASVVVRTNTLDPIMFVLVMALAGIAQRNPVRLFKSSAISVSFAVNIAAYVLYGTGVSLWATLIVVAVNAYTPKPKPPRKILFNFGQLTISTFLAGQTYALVGGEVPPGAFVPTVLAVAVSAVVYFLASSLFISMVISLTEDVKPGAVWRQNFGWMPINYLATAVNGAALALAYQALGAIGVIVFLLPLGVAWYSFRLYMSKSSQLVERNKELLAANEALMRSSTRLEASHVSVIGALLGSLAAKDRYTQGHSAATMFHALAVANKLGLGPDEVCAVELGALFHDIGKIGIPEEILRKPDKLTAAEWHEMKAHPTIGANLLAQVPNLEKIRPIVLAHHEHYDGTGYPNGLKGSEIPLAAQIISVADTYQAMTSSRTYRPALTHEAAIAELRKVSGTQLNPAVVEAFIDEVKHAPPSEDHEREHQHVYQRAVEAVRLTT